jgi:parallel beta-helix repeat protein
MKRKLVLLMTLVITLTYMLFESVGVQAMLVLPPIVIMADGTIDPLTAPIHTTDKVNYVFLDNIYNHTIIVYRSNIVIDGSGFTLSCGNRTGSGIWVGSDNVTIKNINVCGFYFGIGLGDAFNYVSNIVLRENNITDNMCGVALHWSSNNTFYHNNFINNTLRHVHIDTAKIDPSNNTWDNGYPSGGNYWSNYTGTDTNGDGLGEDPHIIDSNNQDNYPFVNVIPEFPSVLVLPLFMISTLIAAILYRRKHSVRLH